MRVEDQFCIQTEPGPLLLIALYYVLYLPALIQAIPVSLLQEVGVLLKEGATTVPERQRSLCSLPQVLLDQQDETQLRGATQLTTTKSYHCFIKHCHKNLLLFLGGSLLLCVHTQYVHI